MSDAQPISGLTPGQVAPYVFFCGDPARLDRITAGIHVYGGELRATRRSEWDPVTFEERPFDEERSLRVFEEANARLQS